MTAPEELSLTLDLHATELVCVVMLANIGHALLAGDRKAVEEVGTLLMDLPDSEQTALKALEKLEVSLRLAQQMATNVINGRPAS